jgi:hypothetical protein
MKRILNENRYQYLLLFVIGFFLFFVGCNGLTPTEPVINSFSTDSGTITEGESATLGWQVTDADTVSINQGIGSVGLSGSTSVSPTSTTTYILTATNSVGSSTATVTITVIPAIVEQNLVIQPSPAEGKDSMVLTEAPDNNYGDYSLFSIGNMSVSILGRGYIQFDLSVLPSDAIIVSANMKLYQYETVGTESFSIGVHQVTAGWLEDTITWNNQPSYLAVPESIVDITVDDTTWLSWDIGTLVQDWLDGTVSNYGVILKDTDEPVGNTYIRCYSSDYTTDSTLAPKLEITYYVP